MRLLFLFSILFVSFSTTAQISIQQARALGVGNTVTVRAIVTSGPSLNASVGFTRFFQDSTGGLSAYDATLLNNLMPGDSIEITGPLSVFNQLLQISPVTSVSVINVGNPLPAPKLINLSTGFATANESQLVRVNTVNFTNSGIFAGNTNYNISDGINTKQVRINALTNFVGAAIPSGNLSVVGIMGRFNATFQITPRSLADVIQTQGPGIARDLTLDTFTNNSLSISFETQAAATTVISYEVVDGLGFPTLVNLVATTQHSAVLNNLTPGQVYKVRAAAIGAQNDTSYTSEKVFATVSNSSGNMEVYFNRSVDNTVASSANNLAINSGTGLDDTLISLINSAQSTLEIAIYNWNNNGISNITQAVNDAKNRGVNVRIVADASTANLGLQSLDPSIPKLFSTTGSAYGIMHNKFVVVDANSPDPNLPKVLTGSTNWTSGQINSDPNSMIIIQDQALARAFRIEFNEMFGSSGNVPSLANRKFGPDKTVNTPEKFMINGNLVRLYFSPSDQTESKIVEAINSANSDIEVATMLITRSTLASPIANKATQGLFVGVVVNDTSDAASKFPYQILAGALTPGQKLFVNNQPGIMHHKYMIVDQNNPGSDPQMVVGSHNWSASANSRNDENTLIIHSAAITNIYFQEWVMRYRENGGVVVITNIAKVPEAKVIQLFPNPNHGTFYIQSVGNTFDNVNLTLVNLQGRVVYQKSYTNQEQIVVEPGNLATGLYIANLVSEGKTHSFKVMVR